ncbi:MAG: UDP-N-acetylmuramate dehydrogenase [Oscillospiraceae bacterium]|nr:UDP-N-acetylmuramate dehydrogenase [Oscillospiraceae bacterium]
MLDRQDILDVCPDMTVLVDEPMRRHTSFAIGGPTDLMAMPSSPAALAALLALARRRETPVLLMGKGTNLLVSDRGVRGLVIKTHSGLAGLRRGGECEIVAGCGVLLSALASAAARWGLSGLAFAHGIPGTVGGAVYMNAGAYDGEMSRVVRRTSYVDTVGQFGVLTGPAHAFSYRHSFFTDHGGSFALEITLTLTSGDSDAIRAETEALDARRRAAQPLDLPSAGSVFKRPLGGHAAPLIEACGLKGAHVGGAAVSDKHAGFIVNSGGATCEDVRRLIEQIQERVRAETGVQLEPEIGLVGDFGAGAPREGGNV